MVHFSRWKIAGIVGVILMGVLLVLPNLFPRAELAGWPSLLPHRQINLGLDLRGGSYLLMEVDTRALVKERLDLSLEAARTRLREAKVGFTTLEVQGDAVVLTLRDPAQADAALAALKQLDGTQAGPGGTPELALAQDGGTIRMTLTELGLKAKAVQAVEQSIEIVRRRIDETGVTEPVIARQGDSRILVQLPGVQDPDRIKRLIGTTAKMDFRMVDGLATAATDRPQPGTDVLTEPPRNAAGKPTYYYVRKKIEVSGGDLVDARASTDPSTGEWVVNFEFNSIGGRRFGQTTEANIGKPFAIVLDNKVISAPVIRGAITGGRGVISGNFTAQSANDLAVLLRAGALPAPLTIIEERTVGPDLGADSIRAGLLASLVGLALVCGYMILTYGLFGLFADIAVIVNLILTLAALTLLEATLTLPGIAGLLLTIGMSVDANILINERIREETKLGKKPFSALEAGFARAFSTIIDSNLTTLIKMVILFIFGAGVVKGFAVTIMIGIITSLFTATVLVRLMITSWMRRTKPATLALVTSAGIRVGAT